MVAEATDLIAELEPRPKHPLLIFGNGPVIDSVTREVPSAQTQAGFEDINLWSQNMAAAASYLFIDQKDVSRIYILGGKTGGDGYASESGLIRNAIAREGVPENVITVEEGSRDTIANLINLVNMVGNSANIDRPFAILGADYHTPRIQILMKLFNIPYGEVFSAESLLRLKAQEQNLPDLALRMHRTTDMNDAVFLRSVLGLSSTDSDRITSFYDVQTGTEKRDFAYRKMWEHVLIRELLQYPESWLGRVSEFENEPQIRGILTRAEQIYPGVLSRYELDPKADTGEQLRQKLAKVEKRPLSQEQIIEWMQDEIRGEWPEEVSSRFALLMN